MTGYGNATGQIEATSYWLEIKTVNNRYFKASVKLPDSLTFLGQDIERFLRKNLHRGTVNCVLRLKNGAEAQISDIDQKTLQKYVDKLTAFARTAGIDYKIDLAALSALPGIIQSIVPDAQQAEKIKDEVLKATGRALDNLKQMRAAEGAALATDLAENCQVIRKSLEEVRSRSSLVSKEAHEKLKKRVDALLADVKFKLDPETLAREVAVYADRCDISEELTRLDSHIEQFTLTCKTGEHPGRKLDFITQEMLREANTIASKSADTQTAQCIIEIKCRIDRLKEQVQNVE